MAEDQTTRVPLLPETSRYGFAAPVVTNGTFLFQSKYTTMVFSEESRRLIFNDRLIWLNEPTQSLEGSVSVSRADCLRILDPLLRSERALAGLDARTVVIDAGHGGDDDGAVGALGAHEKSLTLDIARRIARRLETSRLEVRLTRDRDSGMGLGQRVRAAQRHGADLFVSIHLNSAANPYATGIETYLLPAPGSASTAGDSRATAAVEGNKYDAASMVLAYHVHTHAAERTRAADRGIKHARFAVLKDVSCPAILIECGFVSNRREETRLLRSSHRDSIAQGIAEGVLEYAKRVDAARRASRD